MASTEETQYPSKAQREAHTLVTHITAFLALSKTVTEEGLVLAQKHLNVYANLELDQPDREVVGQAVIFLADALSNTGHVAKRKTRDDGGWVSGASVMKRLGLTRSELMKLTAVGELESEIAGRNVLIRESSIESYLERQRREYEEPESLNHGAVDLLTR